MTKVYQILAKGERKSFSGEGKFSSKQVYLTEPSKEKIDAFVNSCCNGKFPHDLMDLKIETVKTYILELQLID